LSLKHDLVAIKKQRERHWFAKTMMRSEWTSEECGRQRRRLGWTKVSRRSILLLLSIRDCAVTHSQDSNFSVQLHGGFAPLSLVSCLQVKSVKPALKQLQQSIQAVTALHSDDGGSLLHHSELPPHTHTRVVSLEWEPAGRYFQFLPKWAHTPTCICWI